jgi:hypothetical protein
MQDKHSKVSNSDLLVLFFLFISVILNLIQNLSLGVIDECDAGRRRSLPLRSWSSYVLSGKSFDFHCKLSIVNCKLFLPNPSESMSHLIPYTLYLIPIFSPFSSICSLCVVMAYFPSKNLQYQ